jgi:hypothetical protein
MRIVINHLTRMQSGAICVAGIERDTRRHVRPVTERPLGADLLASEGGPFALGHVLELGETTFRGQMPEIEDRLFDPQVVTVLQKLDAAALHRVCAEVAATRLRDVFGPDLEWINHRPDHPGTAAVPEHQGLRSLGCCWVQNAVLRVAAVENRRKVRLRFTEDDMQFSVAVTDVRLYQDDRVTPHEPAIAAMQAAIARHPRTLLSVGLSRAHRYEPRQPARHWLQVNNLLLSEA